MIRILSQNLGHQGVLVTLTSYGTVPRQRQAERIRALDLTAPSPKVDQAVERLLNVLAPAVARLLKDKGENEE